MRKHNEAYRERPYGTKGPQEPETQFLIKGMGISRVFESQVVFIPNLGLVHLNKERVANRPLTLVGTCTDPPCTDGDHHHGPPGGSRSPPGLSFKLPGFFLRSGKWGRRCYHGSSPSLLPSYSPSSYLATHQGPNAMSLQTIFQL